MVALVNGINYSWSEVKLVLFGLPVVGITKIQYARKQGKTNNYGVGSKPVSRGYENETYECTIEIYEDEWRKIIAASPFKDPLAVPPFSIQVICGGERTIPRIDVLEMCEFTDDAFSVSQGDAKILRNIPIIVGGITHL